MKEKVKNFSKKCFCWGCMAICAVIGFAVGYLLSLLFIRLCHMDNWLFDSLESALSIKFPDSERMSLLTWNALYAPWVLLWLSWEDFFPKIKLSIGKMVKLKDLWLLGGKLLLRTAKFVILTILALFIFVIVFMGLCLLAGPLVNWLIQIDILTATHRTAIMIVFAVLIALLFIGLIILIFRIIDNIMSNKFS